LYFQDLQIKGFLEVINKYVEVHATVGGGVSRNLTSPLLKMTHLPIQNIKNFCQLTAHCKCN